MCGRANCSKIKARDGVTPRRMTPLPRAERLPSCAEGRVRFTAVGPAGFEPATNGL